jgi:hypothetical protein
MLREDLEKRLAGSLFPITITIYYILLLIAEEVTCRNRHSNACGSRRGRIARSHGASSPGTWTTCLRGIWW